MISPADNELNGKLGQMYLEWGIGITIILPSIHSFNPFLILPALVYFDIRIGACRDFARQQINDNPANVFRKRELSANEQMYACSRALILLPNYRLVH
jgi:hypothetical protein